MKRFLTLLSLLLLPAIATLAHADDRPLVSAHRLQLGGGVNHEWIAGDEEFTDPLMVTKEFSLGLYGAYNLVPALDLVGSAKRGFDSRLWVSSIGVRITFFAGGN